MNTKRFLFILFSILYSAVYSQFAVRGTILDERKQPVPFARVYVKNDPEQRVTADVNGNYELRLFESEYFLVFSAEGFEPRESYIVIKSGDVVRDIQLFPEKISSLDEVEIQGKKFNYGREYILKVVRKREQINPWNYPHSVDVYIKASENVEPLGKKKNNEVTLTEEQEDPFAAPASAKEVQNFNLLEVQLTRHFSPPNKVKEFRNAYTLRGKDNQLYYTTTVKSNFNFFENLLMLDDLHQTPVTSPISNPGILSYKYKLEAQYEEDGVKIHKIKITARNSSTSTLSGYIYVIDSLWLVQKLDLRLEKGNLLKYDYFEIHQTFSHPGDTLCLLTEQVLTYGTRFKNEISSCRTQATFSNYNFNPSFVRKFFNNELAVTETEAYKRDSSYWNATRTVELSENEKKYILLQDSIRDRVNRKEYLDSVDAIFNKVTFWKVAWFGIDHRNREKRYQWTINSVAASLRPIYIAGPRVAPGFYYFKKWENERFVDTYTEVSYGFLNNDIKGRTWARYRYDPFHLGTVGMKFTHDFDAIRSYDAISQIFKRSNFIEITSMEINYSYELLNGFYLDCDYTFSERRNLKNYKFVTWLDKTLKNDEPTEFNPYQASIFSATLSYVPRQKYMREPYRKVVLGSRWPTFYLYYEKGIPGLFGSDVNHDFLLLGIKQTFKIGTLGTTSYHVKSGSFLNTKGLHDADMKYNRRSDPIWFSNPLHSFQNFDTLLPTTRRSFEGHIIHHDNGSIFNKIPFMKKTGIGLVMGAGILYVTEYKWVHYEVLAGLERNFKFSKRRLRIGIYGVFSDGNNIKPNITYKVSFSVLDDRSMKWNF